MKRLLRRSGATSSLGGAPRSKRTQKRRLAIVLAVVGILLIGSAPAWAQSPTSIVDMGGIDDVAGAADITSVSVEDGAEGSGVLISFDDTSFAAATTGCALINLNGGANVGTALCVTVNGATPALTNVNPVGFGCDETAADRCGGATDLGLFTAIPCSVAIVPSAIAGGGNDTVVRCNVALGVTTQELATGLVNACTFSGSIASAPLDCVLGATAATTTTSVPAVQPQQLAFTGRISDLVFVLGAGFVAAGVALAVANPRDRVEI